MRPVNVVARRALHGLLAQRVAWLVVGVALGALGALLVAEGSPARSHARPLAASGDCADVVMQYTVDRSVETARAAYPCFSGLAARGISEEEFVRQAREMPVPIAGRLRRVGQHQAADGQRIVYYALDGPTQTIAYTVYVEADGRVRRVA